MSINRLESIMDIELLYRRIVYSINKAMTEDVPRVKHEERLETNNRHIFANSDWINENLRKYVVKDDVELISFKRFLWEGRIIVDHANRVTITISSHHSLKSIVKKNSSKPHYLKSILYGENSECKGSEKQLSLKDCYPELEIQSFDPEVLEDDFNMIMKGNVRSTDGYIHYIVAYTVENDEISKIELLLLDKDFSMVDKLNLMDYVNPDFALLTENYYNGVQETEGKEEQNRKSQMLKLKPGVIPNLRVMEEEA